MKNIFLFTISAIANMSLYSQTISLKDNFNLQIRQEEGDLNNDGRIDRVVVSMDTVNETRPLNLEIFFLQPNGKLKLIVSSTKIIEPQYPIDQIEKKATYCGNQIPDFFIENGKLLMISDIHNGQAEHRFCFKNGNFELIYFSKVVKDGENATTETTFNLLTGVYVKQSQLLGSDKIFERSKKKLVVTPLPKIQNFIPFKNQFY
jgi:hypothetical protein